jgi:AAA domain (dynein-related subfamily)/CbbQ/NirQ/NorQ C-terminal
MISQSEKTAFVTEAAKRFGPEVTRQQLVSLSNETGRRHFWLEADEYRVGRGKYRLPITEFGVDMVGAKLAIVPAQSVPCPPAPITNMPEQPKAKITSVARFTENAVIPNRDPLYVEFGFFDRMKQIIGSKQFYPVFVSGLSGNGKTMMVEQACAVLNREYIRVNISQETAEDDLIGGFRLIEGETKWFDGPVIQAMKAGAVLCLDEIDRGSNKLMCLQAILEGKSYLVKKTGEYVEPIRGFNVIATANTKGKGDDSGRFMAATILDDAFLERFPITVEQEYPDVKVETKILNKVFDNLGLSDKEFASNLVKWADIIRKTFEEGAIDELISTRRLVHIAKAFQIFGERTEAIKYCINRFDDETKTAFLDLYTKIDAPQIVEPIAQANPKSEAEEIPF